MPPLLLRFREVFVCYLYIKVIHKSVDEMAEQYGFSEIQKEQLSEPLSEDNKKMWSSVLYYDTA